MECLIVYGNQHSADKNDHEKHYEDMMSSFWGFSPPPRARILMYICIRTRSVTDFWHFIAILTAGDSHAAY